MTAQFQDVLEEDFAEAAPAGTNPATGKPFTAGELTDLTARHVLGTKPSAPEGVAKDMGTLDQFLMGLSGPARDAVMGLIEKGQLIFPGKGNEKAAQADISAARAQRRAEMEDVESTPAGQVGAFVGRALPAMAAPARLPAQMLVEGATQFASPGVDNPDGITSELAGSTARGLTGAATAGVLGKVMGGVGKTAAAAAGKYTDEGARALKTKASAERLGIPTPSVGQLHPQSAAAKIESALPGADDRLIEQAKALRAALDDPMNLPEGQVSDVGRAYINEMKDAVTKRYAISSQKYKAVDELVASKGLQGFMPIYTARSVTATKSPGYDVASELLGRYGFDASSMAGMNANALGKLPLQFSNYHLMRVATNKALNTLDRGIASAERMGASIPAENKAARKWLSDLKTAMDSDAERWAQKNANNAEAVQLYKDATQYFRDVVVPTVIENLLARKATSQRGGFKTGAEALSASTSSAGMQMADRLLPTMSRRGADMTNVLHNLPDVRGTALSRDMTVPTTEGGWGSVARAAMGHPLTAAEVAISRVPGLAGLTRSSAAHRLAAARNPLEGASPAQRYRPDSTQAPLRDWLLPKQGGLARMSWGALQYPQEETQDYAEGLLGRR